MTDTTPSDRDRLLQKILKCLRLGASSNEADAFCIGWIAAVRGKVEAFVGNERQGTAIQAYIDKTYPSLGKTRPINRLAGRSLSEREMGDFSAGIEKGRDARLNHGVSADHREAIGS